MRLLNAAKFLLLSLIFMTVGVCQAGLPAKPKAWLLISVSDLEGKIPLGQHVRPGESRKAQLVRIFEESLEGLGLDLETRDHAQPTDLFQALNDSNTRAIFWISHGAAFAHGLISPPGVLIDEDGNDLAPLFKAIHPNIRYISVIGCESAGLIDSYAARGFYKNNPKLKFGTFLASDLAEPTLGLLQETERARAWLEQPDNLALASCHSDSEFMRIRVVRLTDPTAYTVKEAPTVRIELRGRVLAVLPPLQPGDTQVETIWVPSDELRHNQPLDFEVIATSIKERKPGLGQFVFSTDNPELNWTQLTSSWAPSANFTRAVYTLNLNSNPTAQLQLRRRPC